MTYRGHVEGGVVVFESTVALPDGTPVIIALDDPQNEATPVGKALLRFSGIVKDLPSDMARNHDHYLHGRPKK